MAKASLTISIAGEYKANAIDKANRSLQNLQAQAAATQTGLAGSFAKAGYNMEYAGTRIQQLGSKMESVGSAATKAITVPIGIAGAACVAAAVEIDTALTNVRKTVDGTEEQYIKLKDAAIEFSKTNAVSASQILDIQSLGAQLGFAIDELQEFGEVVSGLDIATNMDAEQAATEMAQFANITKMAHDDISNYGSAIVGLGNNLATTESDISSMAMRLAAAGTQVGMSQADILGLAGALSSMGVEAEAGGTAVSTIMSQIDKDVATSSEGLETWAQTAGMSAQDFANAWKEDPVQALASVLSGMEKATEEGGNMSLMLDELGITSLRQTDVMKRLAGNSELVAKAVKLSNDEWKKNTALQKEVDNRNESLQAKFDILGNKVFAVAQEFGGPFADALIDAVDAAEPMIQGATDLAKGFSEMNKEDQKMVIGLVAAAAAFGPVVLVSGKLTHAVGDGVVMLGKMTKAIGVTVSGVKNLTKEELKAEIAASSASKGTSALGESAKGASSKAGLLTKGLGALKNGLIGLGVAAAIYVIGEFAKGIADAAKREEDLTKATDGLRGAYEKAQGAYDNFNGSLDTTAENLNTVKISTQEVIEEQAKLAEKANETWSEIGTDAAQVDYYARMIDELTSKSSLSREEQEKLKIAVDGFNQLTGDSIEIINATTGELSKQKDAIDETAEAYKRQARASAARELAKEITQQLIKDELALKQKTDEVNDAQAEYFRLLGEDYTAAQNYKQYTLDPLVEKQGELQSIVDASNDTLDQYFGIIADATPKFADFDQALSDTKTDLSDFGNIGEDQLTKLRDNFHGKLEDIVKVCADEGIKIPQTLADSIMQNSGLPEGEQQMMIDRMVLIFTKGDAEKAAEILGHDVDAGLAEGIRGASDSAEAAGEMAMKAIMKAKDNFESHSPSQVMYRLGEDVDLGLAQGIDGSQSEPINSMDVLCKLTQDAISGLPGYSEQTGFDSGSKLSASLGSWSGSVGTSATNLFNSATGGISPTPAAFGTTADEAARQYSSTIGNASAQTEGRNLAYTAKDGLGSVDASGTGTNFVQGFANGMNGVSIWNIAWNIGRSALGAIKSALGIASPSKEAMVVGDFFAQGLAIGAERNIGKVESAYKEVGQAATQAVRDGLDTVEAKPIETMSINQRFAQGAPKAYAVNMRRTSQTAPVNNYEINVNVHIEGTNPVNAAQIGKTVGESLFDELQRRERQLHNAS